MAEKLLQYYKFIKDEQGLKGAMALAKMTKMPSNRAALAEDSEENILKFRIAVKEITGKELPN